MSFWSTVSIVRARESRLEDFCLTGDRPMSPISAWEWATVIAQNDGFDGVVLAVATGPGKSLRTTFGMVSTVCKRTTEVARLGLQARDQCVSVRALEQLGAGLAHRLQQFSGVPSPGGSLIAGSARTRAPTVTLDRDEI